VTPGPGEGESLDLIEVCAELVRHGKLLPEQIENLDRWWIANIYFHARGKYGELVVRPKPKRTSIKTSRRDMFEIHARKHGWEDWQIAEAWERIEQRRLERKTKAADNKPSPIVKKGKKGGKK
jgi:hypothetical protein